MFRRKQKAGRHEENREKICLICLKVDTRIRGSVKKIPSKGKIANKINEIFENNVCDNDGLPNGICSGCMRKLYDERTIELPNLTQFNEQSKKIRTISSIYAECECKICLGNGFG